MIAKIHPRRYLICVDNVAYAASLEVCKVYPLLELEPGTPKGMVRIVDETGEDYLYPASLFEPIDVPPRVRELFA